MLHLYLNSGQIGGISDDQGLSGVSIFNAFKFDGTAGGGGDIQEILLYIANDNTNYKYNTPVLSLSGSDPVEQKSWFTLLDNKYVAGATPTDIEWNTYGIAGTGALNIDDISEESGLNPERKFWLRCSVPAGITTANLVGLKVLIQAVEEEV